MKGTKVIIFLMDNLPRRAAMRVETQEGPWSVSVAESPHDARSYSLYIKTPTHNLTLTRSAMEILELDAKLRDHDHQAKIPALPFTPDSLPPPPKRKSTFLNTLSRLASPTSNKTSRRNTNTALPTPIASPTREINDPFSSFGTSDGNSQSVVATPSATSTGLASYLTTVSNAPTLRQSRVWKRFVRVRTDDLESARPEKAIKRVRSDLAAHVGGLPGQKDEELDQEDTVPGSTDQPLEDSLPTPVQSPKELDLDEEDVRNEFHQVQVTDRAKPDAIRDAVEDEVKKNQEPSSPATPATLLSEVEAEAEAEAPAPLAPEDVPVPTTPTASEAQHQDQAQAVAPSQQRIHRSQSADPDKSSRLSRAFAQSTPDIPATPTELDPGNISSATGDESSISITNSKGTKRSKSRTTKKSKEPKKSQRKVVISDFEMMRVLGKGCAGKVLLVRQKASGELYALKAITKRHVLAHQELQHTLTEQAVLKRMAAEGKDPFVVKLWWSFHDKENLFLVMDFHPGGDLATQLARWGRLGRDRARFYAAEIVEGVEGLHAAGVIYRDLKPENILIGSDGHIVLTDFGLSKEFPRPSIGNTSSASAAGTPQAEITAQAAWMSNSGSLVDGEQQHPHGVTAGWPGQSVGLHDQTTTFCGTAEYLAPEVIQGLPYSYEVDWWSFGTMLYEMLTGITPFWANNHSDMYVRVLQDELQFPEDRAMDQDTKSLIRGLLQRNPGLRICEPRIKKHPYFSMIDWSHVYYKRYIPPYIPPIDPSNASDTQNFDETFLDMEPVLDEYQDEQDIQEQDPNTDASDADVNTDTDRNTGTETEDGEDTATTPSQSRSSSIRPGGVVGGGGVVVVAVEKQQEESTVDVFDGYSFKGRHSVLIDSSDEDEEVEDEEDLEEGSGSEVTGTTNITTTTITTTGSSETGGDDTSSVLGSVISPPETARPIDEQEELVAGDEDDVPEPKTPEARPVSLQPVAVSPAITATSTSAAEAAGVATTPAVAVGVVNDAEDIERLMATAKELEHRLEEGEPKTPTEDNSKASMVSGDASKPAWQKPTIKGPAAAVSTAKAKQRRERSGIPALDKDLPDDTEAEAGEDTDRGGRHGLLDDEDDDWDFVEAVDGEDRNGAKGTSLFARGVVDRYRLAVFRKASTPSKPSQVHQQPRSASGQSGSKNGASGAESPTQKRGRTALAFTRKGTRQFLQPKNNASNNSNRNVSTPTKSNPPPPPSSYSAKKSTRKSFGPLSTTLLRSGSPSQKRNSESSMNNPSSSSSPHTRSSTTTTAMGLSPSASPVVTTSTSSATAAGMLTPSLSMGSSAVMSLSPSLRSRQSATSVGGNGNGGGGSWESPDQSSAAAGLTNGVNVNGELGAEQVGQGQVDEGSSPPVNSPVVTGGPGGEKGKATKKLKKYKEGAEKVFSLFSSAGSPRQ